MTPAKSVNALLVVRWQVFGMDYSRSNEIPDLIGESQASRSFEQWSSDVMRGDFSVLEFSLIQFMMCLHAWMNPDSRFTMQGIDRTRTHRWRFDEGLHFACWK